MVASLRRESCLSLPESRPSVGSNGSNQRVDSMRSKGDSLRSRTDSARSRQHSPPSVTAGARSWWDDGGV